MRRSVIGAAGALVLAVSALPATASAATRVDGDNFDRAGLQLATHSCTEPVTTPPSAPATDIVSTPRPPSGRRSLRWTPATEGFGVGVVAPVAQPSKPVTMRLSVYSVDAEASSIALATYRPPGDTGIWRGVAPLAVDRAGGWHRVRHPNLYFTWQHFAEDGTYDDTYPSTTLADFTEVKGAGGDARLGVLYGCDGDAFQVDSLSLTSSGRTTTYDFEGYATRTSFSTAGKVRRTLRITAGEQVDVTANLRRAVGGTPIASRLRLDSKRLTARKYADARSVRTGDAGNHRLSIRPFKSTAYRARYAGTTELERSAAVLKVLVRSNVAARLVKGTVTAGRTFTVAGRVLPQRAAGLKLQKYVNGSWRTVKKAKARKDGRYAVTMAAPRPGKSYWRIQTNAGGGNISGKSVWLKLTTKPKPAPPPPPNDPNPPQPPPEPTDPPPPPPSEPPPPPPPTRAWVG